MNKMLNGKIRRRNAQRGRIRLLTVDSPLDLHTARLCPRQHRIRQPPVLMPWLSERVMLYVFYSFQVFVMPLLFAKKWKESCQVHWFHICSEISPQTSETENIFKIPRKAAGDAGVSHTSSWRCKVTTRAI